MTNYDGLIRKLVLTSNKNNKYCTDDGTHIICDKDTSNDLGKFTVHHLNNNTMTMKGGKDSKYCTINKDNIIACNNDSKTDNSVFTIKKLNDSIGIMGNNNKYCSFNGNNISCDKINTETDSEIFKLRDANNNLWDAEIPKEVPGLPGVLGVPGKISQLVFIRGDDKSSYCSRNVQGVIACNQVNKDGAKYLIEKLTNGKIAIKNPSTNKYCSVTNNGIVCNSDKITNTEMFTIEKLKKNMIALKSSDNKYCSNEGSRVICNKNKIGRLEKFGYSNA